MFKRCTRIWNLVKASSVLEKTVMINFCNVDSG